MAISSSPQAPRARVRNRLGRLSQSVLSLLASSASSNDKLHPAGPGSAGGAAVPRLIVTLLMLSAGVMALSAALRVLRPLAFGAGGASGHGGMSKPHHIGGGGGGGGGGASLSVADYPAVLVSRSEPFNARAAAAADRDDAQTSLVSAPSEDEVHRGRDADATEEAVARLIVITMDRAASLERLLGSLRDANYGEDAVDLDIWIDRRASGAVDEKVLAASRAVEWKHGTKTIHKRTGNAGLYQQWIYTWNITAETTEFAVILEDDLEVSPAFYQWLRVARAAYAQDPEVAAFTLQRSTLRPRQHGTLRGDLKIAKEHHVFKYRLLGTWGFAPQRDQWVEFRKWFEAKRASGDKPYVSGLMTTQWYKSQEVNGFAPNMWSQWWIKFVDEKNYFTVTGHLPDGTTLAANWRESGLHYSKAKPKADFPVFRGNDEQFVMPDNPIHVDWDGSTIKGKPTVAANGSITF